MDMEMPPFRTGDIVRHVRTGEEWVVAYADPSTGYMSWLGWPDGRAKTADCRLTLAASDEVHRRELADLKRSGGRRATRALALYGDPSPTSPVAKDERHG